MESNGLLGKSNPEPLFASRMAYSTPPPLSTLPPDDEMTNTKFNLVGTAHGNISGAPSDRHSTAKGLIADYGANSDGK